MDRGGYSLLVDRKQPEAAVIEPAFPADAATPIGPADEFFSAADLGRTLELALTYSYFIEHNRIWTDDFIVAKHRAGPIGTKRLVFLGQYTRFDNGPHDA